MSEKKMYLDFEAIENKTSGTHSYYARAVSKGTVGLEELLTDAFSDTGTDPYYAMMIFYKIRREIMRKLKKGMRCDLDGLMTLSPALRLSVKDSVDKNGDVVPADQKDMNPQDGETYISVEMNKKFVDELKRSIYWRRIKSDKPKKPSSN